MYMRELYKKKM